ncbi:hypothetical protein KRM28CT15_46380 [Krasilnikovia sp. M28-CT-15]
MLVPVGAQQIGQHKRVARVGLLTGLPVSFPVTGNRPRVDREHGHPGSLQRHDQQVLVGLDRDRHRSELVGVVDVLGQQGHQAGESGRAGVDPGPSQHTAVGVEYRHVMMLLGPVDTAGDLHSRPFVVNNS